MNQVEGLAIDVSDGIALDIDGERLVVQRLEYDRTPERIVVYALSGVVDGMGKRRRISIPFPAEFAEKVYKLMGRYMEHIGDEEAGDFRETVSRATSTTPSKAVMKDERLDRFEASLHAQGGAQRIMQCALAGNRAPIDNIIAAAREEIAALKTK
mgnify:CR=1 FL=1